MPCLPNLSPFGEKGWDQHIYQEKRMCSSMHAKSVPGVPKMSLSCFPQNPQASASEGGGILVFPTLLEDFSPEDAFQHSCKKQPSLLEVCSLPACKPLTISLPAPSKQGSRQLFVLKDKNVMV